MICPSGRGVPEPSAKCEYHHPTGRQEGIIRSITSEPSDAIWKPSDSPSHQNYRQEILDHHGAIPVCGNDDGLQTKHALAIHAIALRRQSFSSLLFASEDIAYGRRQSFTNEHQPERRYKNFGVAECNLGASRHIHEIQRVAVMSAQSYLVEHGNFELQPFLFRPKISSRDKLQLEGGGILRVRVNIESSELISPDNKLKKAAFNFLLTRNPTP